jgi:predicted flap endonuclease-1-like 5' DNA nuclease/Cdc6-like AAA superfamily ATPase
MTASGIAKQTLHSTATFHEPTGVEFGIHDDTNQALVVDPFARDTGSNMGAFGKIRTGKSTTTKMVANEIKERYPEYDVHWVDPLEGLAGPALANEADRIPVGGDVGLNVFDVEPPSDDKIDVIGAAAPYRMLVDRVMSLIETYYSIEERSLTGKKDTWEVAVRETLDDFGIVPNDPDSLRREKPTLRDVIRKLGEIEANAEQYSVDDLETEQSADHRAEIASRIRTEDIGPFLDGGKFAHLAEPTGFDLSESGGAYLDLQLREAKGEVGLQLGLLLMAVYEQAKRSDSPTVILIDEAHYLLKHADNLEFLEQVIRHSGHYQISIIFSTQNVTDFFKKTGDDEGAELTLRDSAKKILDNMSIMMFHHLPEMSETIADELKLNADEARYIRNATPGSEGNGYSEMLLAIDDSGERHTYPARVEMDWNTNPVEFSIIDYDPSNPDHGAWHDYLGERIGDRYDGDDSWSTAVDTWTAGKQVHDRPDPDADAQERAEQQVAIRAQEQSPAITSERPSTTTTGADPPERETDATTMSTDTQSPTQNASADNADSVATIPTRSITGIGPSTADTLADHGIETVSDVIDTGVTALAEIDGFRHARAATVIEAARDTADREIDTTERTDGADAVDKTDMADRLDARIDSDGEHAHIGRRRSTSEQGGDD